VAVIQQGTTQDQRVLVGTLGTISQMVAAAQVRPPTLIIVGEVVRLHEKLAWFTPELAAT
jgi:uroporphyrin-III C-methyltransferase/precorrin-2 dehydrogenase/sirohydrochlorin ferrochelatase